jgi:hypothetical protein
MGSELGPIWIRTAVNEEGKSPVLERVCWKGADWPVATDVIAFELGSVTNHTLASIAPRETVVRSGFRTLRSASHI